MNAILKPFLTAEEYLAWEETQDTKHEYINGEVFEVYAMAGAKDAHVTITGNVYMALRNHLRGSPCRTYISDMKLRVEAANTYFYPDVFVTCDPRDHASEQHKSHPTLIVEVLSPSTANFDRSRKFAHYRLLDSLREYILIDPDTFMVEVFRRDATDHWVLYPFEGEADIEFASLGFRAALSAVFEDVIPPGTENPAVPP